MLLKSEYTFLSPVIWIANKRIDVASIVLPNVNKSKLIIRHDGIIHCCVNNSRGHIHNSLSISDENKNLDNFSVLTNADLV